MTGIARWYSKWEDLDVDSDGEDIQPIPELDAATKEVLKRFPPDVGESIAREPSKCKREALLALNCYICELHSPPRQTPAVQKELLRALCEALRGLEEGGEVETLLFRIADTLCKPAVIPDQVEHAIGAMALLQPVVRDERVVEVILVAAVRRLAEFSAKCLAHACWSAAALGNSDASQALLKDAMTLGEKRCHEFEANDVALFAWACATSSPLGARSALNALFHAARLPALESHDARIVAWALERFDIDAAPIFGPPPATVSPDIANILHHRMNTLCRRSDIQVLCWDGDRPLILSVDGLLAPEEADALLKLAQGRWQPLANFAKSSAETSAPTWRVPDVAALDAAASTSVPIVQRLRRRVASLFGLPESHCESPQMSRHLHGTISETQVDFFANDGADKGSLYLGGQRVSSVMVCLSNLNSSQGGETIFPLVGKEGCRVSTSCGQALVWLNIRSCGKIDERLSYTSAPLTDEKAMKVHLHLWVRAHPIMHGSSEDSALELEREQLHIGADEIEHAARVKAVDDSCGVSKQAIAVAFQANAVSPIASAIAASSQNDRKLSVVRSNDSSIGVVFEAVD